MEWLIICMFWGTTSAVQDENNMMTFLTELNPSYKRKYESLGSDTCFYFIDKQEKTGNKWQLYYTQKVNKGD